MATMLKGEHAHIKRVEGVCGGEPIVDGLRVPVRLVAVLYHRGETLPEISDALNLTESQVVHALSYYFDHTGEIDALIQRDELAHASSCS